MPRELVAIGPRQPLLRDVAEPPLGAGDVRIQSEFGAAKHGTEIPIYRGDAPTSQARYDPVWRCFLPREASSSPFPVPLGNMCVGMVTAVGDSVTTCRLGDRVFGHLPLQDVHVVFVAHVGPTLNLGQEFHFNRINLIAARTVSQPFPEVVGWDHRRVESLALKWLTSGKLSSEGIVRPIVPFDDCVEVYRRIEDHPEESVKLGVRFSARA